MVTLGEMLSLATPCGATMGKFWLLWVSRLLKNAFATIVDPKMWVTLTHIPSPNLKVHILLCRYVYIIFYQPETLFHLKSLFLGHIYTQNCLKMSYYNCCDFTFKKVSLTLQRDTPWCMKSMLHLNLR